MLKNLLVFSVFLGLLGANYISYNLGLRAWETGNAKTLSKGMNVRVTGLCDVIEDEAYLRVPAFQESEIKITTYDQKEDLLTGVIRETAEAVSCRISKVTIDPIPMWSQVLNSPRPLALTKKGEKIKKEKPKIENKDEYKFLNKEVLISGICENAKGKEESIIDHKASVVNAIKVGDYWDLRIVSKTKRENYKCSSRDVSVSSYVAPDENGKPKEINLVNQEVRVTGDCIPYTPKGAKPNTNEAIFALNYNKVFVRSQVLNNDGDLIKITGVVRDVKGTPIVECDLLSNPDIVVTNPNNK